MQLGRIKEDVRKFAVVISKTLDVDVLIVDHNLHTVGNTFRYFDKYTVIRRVSIIGQVITTGQVLAIDNKGNFNACKACPDLPECEMAGFIGVPVFYNECVVGAIALILPKQRVTTVFKDVRNSIEFLERMADLLSNKLQNCDDYNALNIIKQEREVLMDAIEDAIISTDNMGYISYYNKQFAKFFKLEKNCVGVLIHEVIPHKVIADFLDKQVTVKDKLIFCECSQDTFYGLVSCNNIAVNGQHSGMLFTFKPISQINSELSEISGTDTRVTFCKYEKTLFPAAVVDEGKRLAVTDKMILIETDPGRGADLLAQCIHDFSDRNKAALITVNCHLSHKIQDQLIFGELGKIHMAHNGTIYFANIEELPLYLQQKLVRFLHTKELIHQDGRGIAVDVRFIFSSTANLKKRAENGLFSDELYYRIIDHTIGLNSLRVDRVQLRHLLDENIRFFKAYYQRPELYFEDEVMRQLYRYHWPRNIVQVEAVINRLVQTATDKVTMEHLTSITPMLLKSDANQSLHEIEKDKIVQLIKNGHSKNDAAKILGLSRATLYRKIKQYQL